MLTTLRPELCTAHTGASMRPDPHQPDSASDDLEAFRDKVRSLTVEELLALANLLRRQEDELGAELKAVLEQIDERRGSL